MVGIGAAIVVLLISFGSLLAMGLPITTALLGLGTGFGLIALLSRVMSMPDFAGELALMIGLGVGVDYSLFILTRFREAYRRNGGDVAAAVAEAMNTAGRAVIFAGTTVVIALMGMFALGVGLLNGLAVAAALAVLLVLAASLTLLPALLTSFGGAHRAARRAGAPPQGVARGRDGAAGRAQQLLDALDHDHPAPPVGRLDRFDGDHADACRAGAGAAPGQHRCGQRLLPATRPARAYDLLAKGFGQGFSGPLLIAARLPHAGETAPAEQLAAAVRATPGVAQVAAPRLSPSGEVATISAYPTTSPQSRDTEQLVKHLRADVIPALARQLGDDRPHRRLDRDPDRLLAACSRNGCRSSSVWSCCCRRWC